jgi:hypothetical protein
VAHAGRGGEGSAGLRGRTWARGKERAREGERESVLGWAEREGLGWLLLFLFLLSFLFYTQTFKQHYLNSNKFEFKPYKFNTNKTMLQHECTNNLIL